MKYQVFNKLYIILLLLVFSITAQANELTGIFNTQLDGKYTGVQFKFSDSVIIPSVFNTSDNKTIIFDFPSSLVIEVNKADLAKLKNLFISSVQVVANKKHSRIVIQLASPENVLLTQQTSLQLKYTFKSLFPKKRNSIAKMNENKKSDSIVGMITDITFTKDDSGNGVFTVKLPESDVNVAISSQSEKRIVIKFHQLHIAKDWAHVMNVTSFDTLAHYITGKNGFAYSEFTIETDKSVNFTEVKMGNEYKLIIAPQVDDGTAFSSNQKISLNLQDIKVSSALQILANFANINLVISDQVVGMTTLRLNDIPWQEALEIILVSESLGKREIGNIIYIAPAGEIASHEQAELAAKNASQAVEDLKIEYLRLNYADATEMAAVIQASGSGFLGPRGTLSTDTRTNTIIVQDTQDGISKITAVIKQLDGPTKEVSIKARVVEISRTTLKEMGFRFFVGQAGIPISAGSNVQGAVNSSTETLRPSVVDEAGRAILSPGETVLGLSFTRLFGNVDLTMELSALESLNKAKSLSNPRLVVADNREAYIKQGTEIPYLQSTASGAASIAFKQAVLELLVKPQISPNNTITLDVTVKKDTPEANILVDAGGVPSIRTREVKTKLVVQNGETVVLGGVYEKTLESSVRKVPLLGDIPLLGWLFKFKSDRIENRELLIFLTTTIMENKAQ